MLRVWKYIVYNSSPRLGRVVAAGIAIGEPDIEKMIGSIAKERQRWPSLQT